MNYENLADIGDEIKSYDFFGRDDHITGIVVEKNAFSYSVKVLKSVTESEEFNKLRYGQTLTVPFETMIEYEGRIQLLKTFDEGFDELLNEMVVV
jgi:hypothetical protein